MPGIRKATSNDIDLIQQLAYATWPTAYGALLSPSQLNYMLELIYSKDALANQIKNLGHQFIFIYDDDIALGFASYSPKDKGNRNVFRLHKLYVLPDQQGKGFGKFLSDFIIDEIRPLGASILELNVNRHNVAFHFYTKLGFTIAREEDIDIGNGYFMNDYVMELKM